MTDKRVRTVVTLRSYSMRSENGGCAHGPTRFLEAGGSLRKFSSAERLWERRRIGCASRRGNIAGAYSRPHASAHTDTHSDTDTHSNTDS